MLVRIDDVFTVDNNVLVIIKDMVDLDYICGEVGQVGIVSNFYLSFTDVTMVI